MGTSIPVVRRDNRREQRDRAIPAKTASAIPVWEQRPVRVKRPKANSSASARGSVLKPKRQPGWLDQMCGAHPLD